MPHRVIFLGLILLAGLAMAADEPTPPAAPAAPAPILKLTGKHEQAFLAAATAASGAKRDKVRAEVAAWPPLGVKAAEQLRKLVQTKWPFAPPAAGWKGKPGKTGGMREIDVPGLGKREYYLALPDGYTPKSNWPLALSLHGAGGEGKGDYAWCWEKWAKLWPGLIACPSGQPAGDQWFPKQRPFVQAVLDDVCRTFAIDDDRVALHGFSNGGNGSWYYGQHWPSRWSAMFTRGGGSPELEDMLVNLLHLPCTIVHGSGDPVIKVDHDRASAAALTQLGFDVTFKEMPGKHEPFLDQVNPEVIPWLAKARRDPYPKTVKALSRSGEDGRYYWIDCAKRTGDRVEVAATVEGQGIALTVQGTGELVLWLADPLLDLDQPVIVTWNGKQTHAGLVPRRGSDLLAWLDATCDRAAAPVARLEVVAP